MKRLTCLLLIALISTLMFSVTPVTFLNFLQRSVASSTLTGITANPSALPEKQPRWSYQSVGVVNVVSISSNGQYLTMGTSDGYVCLFSSNSSMPLSADYMGGAVSVIRISRYGIYLAAATGNTLMIYNLTAGILHKLWSFSNVPGYQNEGGIYSLAFSSDGRFLAVGTWKGYYGERSYVHLFDITSSTPLWSAIITNARYNPPDYVTVDISSDGRYIVAGSTRNNQVYLFSRTNSTPLYTYNTGAPITAVSMSSNGENFVAGGDKLYYFQLNLTVPIWIRNLDGFITSKALEADGAYITLAVRNRLYLLRDNSEILWSYELDGDIGSISASDNIEYQIVMSGNNTYLFSRDFDADPATQNHDPFWFSNLKTSVNSVSISLDGCYCVVGSGNNLFLFDSNFNPNLTPSFIQFSNDFPEDGDTIKISTIINNTGNLDSPPVSVQFFFNNILVGTNQIKSIASGTSLEISISCVVSPQGSHNVKVIVDPHNIIFESNETDNVLTKSLSVRSKPFIDTGANPVIADITETGTVKFVSISGNGYYVIAVSSDGYLNMLFKNHTYPLWSYKIDNVVHAARLSEDGSYLACASGNKLYVFSRASSTPLWSFSNVPGYQNEGGIYSLAFSSDGRFLAVGTWKGYYGERSYVHLFDITSSTPLWSAIITNARYNPPDYVTVDISSDGRYIVAGSTRNNQVYLFSRTNSTPLYTYNTGAPITAVSMSSNGENFVAGGDKLYYFDKDVIVPLWVKDLEGSISSISISGNSMYIAVTAGNYLYLLSSYNIEIWTYNMSTSISCALISGDGSHIIVACSNKVYLFSSTTDDNLTTPVHDPIWTYNAKDVITSISISCDGRYSIFGSGGRIFFFDSEHKADLLPTGMLFSNNKPNEGDIITLYVTINNTGAYKSYYANISFYDESTLIGKMLISPLPPNSSITISKNYQCTAGTRIIKVLVDPDNAIYESSKINNQLTAIIFVNARPTAVKLSEPINVTASSVELLWTGNTDSDFMKYEIYLSTVSGQTGILVGAIEDQAVTNYVVSGLKGATTYYFVVRVVDTNGAISDSNQVYVMTLPTPVTLFAPTNPTASSLDITWTKNVDEVFTCYEIYISMTQGQRGDLIARILNQSQTTYTVKGLMPSTTYYFTIRVVANQLFSDSDQIAGTTAPPPPLPTPVNLLSPISITPSSIFLTWSRNSDPDFLCYQIIWSVEPLQPSSGYITNSHYFEEEGEGLIIYDQSVTSYNVTALEESTTYYFVIRTFNRQYGYSDSNIVKASTSRVPISFIPLIHILEVIGIWVSVTIGALIIRYLKKRRIWP